MAESPRFGLIDDALAAFRRLGIDMSGAEFEMMLAQLEAAHDPQKLSVEDFKISTPDSPARGYCPGDRPWLRPKKGRGAQ